MDDRDYGTQLRKGVVEGCVLAVLDSEVLHGWELARVLQEQGNVIGSIGTLYPVLTRLERRGELASSEESAPNGRRRRYYAITPRGRESLAAFRSQWSEFVAGVTTVLDRKESDDDENGVQQDSTQIPA